MKSQEYPPPSGKKTCTLPVHKPGPLDRRARACVKLQTAEDFVNRSRARKICQKKKKERKIKKHAYLPPVFISTIDNFYFFSSTKKEK